MDVGDGGTLGALGVRSGGNVLGEVRDSDWRVDASDVDTDISSRLNMYNIFILIRTCLFACLMLGLPRRTHAPLAAVPCLNFAMTKTKKALDEVIELDELNELNELCLKSFYIVSLE